MKFKTLIPALLTLTTCAFGQTTNPTAPAIPSSLSWGGAEFIHGKDTAIIALNQVAGYSPFPNTILQNISLGFDVFGGYDTYNNNPIAGVAAVVTCKVSGNFSLLWGIGTKYDISKQFQLTELTLSNAGGIIGGELKF